MASKFKVGELWKNKDGDKCIVLEVGADEVLVYSYNDDETTHLRPDGVYCDSDEVLSGYNLIEPWADPIQYKAVLHLHRYKDGTMQIAEASVGMGEETEFIGSAVITMTEGEFCDE